MDHSLSTPLFTLGRIVATPGAREALKKANQLPQHLLDRHVTGDWGEVSVDDAQENRLSFARGLSLLSYTTAAGDKILIATEADWSVTTLLLPREY
jgi:hypothetical protein